MFGVDPDTWFAEHPRLGIGGRLATELADRFEQMTDMQAARIATELDVDYVIVERGHERSTPCFQTVRSNDTFTVQEVQEQCRTR